MKRSWSLIPAPTSRYLTGDMKEMLPGLCRSVAEKFGWKAELIVHADQVINSSKGTDHHAVIPTRTMAEADLDTLPKGEQEVLMLVTGRLLASVADPMKYMKTKVILKAGGETFTASGRTVTDAGWRQLEQHIGKKKEKRSSGTSQAGGRNYSSVFKGRMPEGKDRAAKALHGRFPACGNGEGRGERDTG